MSKIDILISPPIAFLIMSLFFSVLYILAGKFALTTKRSKEKVSTYACGENIPGFKFQFGYNLFFVFALFFTIMHVAALIFATLPSGLPLVYFGIFYLFAIFLSVISMLSYIESDYVISESEEESD
ncbi:MAG: hypothetical protein NC906_05455 [Candidatus Omnitrophica bacterium]|nr:hypothetical protein [Candidatus Omnitrophota bacterium]MCM8816914.1 hypothetical protein [Candidatus Omnitrophota bacterium]